MPTTDTVTPPPNEAVAVRDCAGWVWRVREGTGANDPSAGDVSAGDALVDVGAGAAVSEALGKGFVAVVLLGAAGSDPGTEDVVTTGDVAAGRGTPSDVDFDPALSALVLQETVAARTTATSRLDRTSLPTLVLCLLGLRRSSTAAADASSTRSRQARFMVLLKMGDHAGGADMQNRNAGMLGA